MGPSHFWRTTITQCRRDFSRPTAFQMCWITSPSALLEATKLSKHQTEVDGPTIWLRIRPLYMFSSCCWVFLVRNTWVRGNNFFSSHPTPPQLNCLDIFCFLTSIARNVKPSAPVKKETPVITVQAVRWVLQDLSFSLHKLDNLVSWILNTNNALAITPFKPHLFFFSSLAVLSFLLHLPCLWDSLYTRWVGLPSWFRAEMGSTFHQVLLNDSS